MLNLYTRSSSTVSSTDISTVLFWGRYTVHVQVPGYHSSYLWNSFQRWGIFAGEMNSYRRYIVHFYYWMAILGGNSRFIWFLVFSWWIFSPDLKHLPYIQVKPLVLQWSSLSIDWIKLPSDFNEFHTVWNANTSWLILQDYSKYLQNSND